MAVVVATVKSEGKPLPETVELLTVETHHELNRIPEATLTLLDGGAMGDSFVLSDSDWFKLGAKVTVALRYEGEGQDEAIFAGFVVRHGVRAAPGGFGLRVELRDASFKLTRQRKSAVFRKLSDSAAIEKLLKQASLEVGELPSIKDKHEELIQYQASDWDFIVSRADVRGLAVRAALGKVSLQPMLPAAAAKATYVYGAPDLHELELELDGGSQWGAVHSVAWEASKAAATAPTKATEPKLKAGNTDVSGVARVLGGGDYHLLHPVPLSTDELKGWADARLARSRSALVRGRLAVPGRADLWPGDALELKGIGSRFDGDTLVSAVTQRVDHEGWQTVFSLGLSPQWFAREPDIEDVPAGGLLPAATGLRLATVAACDKDPSGEHRIKVALPALTGTKELVWARCARPDAGAARGSASWPKPGDEVVVSFLGGDPRSAVVLGSLYSSATPPPDLVGAPHEDKKQHAFISEAGISVVVDDEHKAIRIETPGKNTVVVDDNAKAITAKDQHGNQLLMDDSGITLKSSKDLQLEASGKVVIKGSAVDIQ